MPRFAANLSMLFTEQDFLARFDAAAKAGFSGDLSDVDEQVAIRAVEALDFRADGGVAV